MNSEIASPENIPKIGVGIMGYGFGARAHIYAYKRLRDVYWPPPAFPQCISLCGRNEKNVREAADRFEFKRWYMDWRKMLEDKEIQIFDNCATNDAHAESCIEAARRGMHILCEKPLGLNAEEARLMLQAVEENGVRHMCGFNYRFVPAVRLTKELIEKGVIGEIYHFYGRYVVDRAMDPNIPLRWIFDKSSAGSGALGALGSHLIDLARFLVGEPANVMALSKTFIKKRPIARSSEMGEVTVDDAVSSLIEFENGAIGNFETSRFCAGRKNHQSIEINGSRGSIIFDLEELNRLKVYLFEEMVPEAKGFRDVVVTEGDHPLFKEWWPTGHTLGWEHAIVHEIKHFIESIVKNREVGPWGATFVDGYRCAVICDAMLKSAELGKKVSISY